MSVYLRNQGTITFVEIDNVTYGITNQHVTAYRGRAQDSVSLIALKSHTPVRGKPFLENDPARDQTFPYDLAIFRLDADVIRKGGKEPYVITRAPAHIPEGETLLAVGFPGQARTTVEPHVRHQAYHVVAPRVGDSPRIVTLRADLPDEKMPLRFGGMSGGPIFRLAADERYELVGIIEEGRGPHERVDGTEPASGIHVRGFILGEDVLEAIKRLRK